MSRAPFQVLVFLRRLDANGPEYLVLKRADLSVWQGVAGGGEGEPYYTETAEPEVTEEPQEEHATTVLNIHRL